MRSLKILLSTGAGVFNQISRSIISLITRKIFLVYIGASLLGLNTLYASVIAALTLTELGVGTAVAMFLYQPLVEGDTDKITAYMNVLKKFNYIMMLIVSVGGVLLIPVVFGIVNGDYRPTEIIISYLLYVGSVASGYFLSYYSTLFNADQSGYVVSLVNAFCNIGMNILQVFLVVVFHSYYLYLICVIAYNLINNLILANMARKKYSWLRSSARSLSSDEKRSFVLTIKNMLVYRVANYLIQSMDHIIISVLLGTIVVAYYGNYCLIINMLVAIAGNFGAATSASLGNQLYSDHERLYTSVKSVLFAQYLIFSATGVAMFVLSDSFVQVMFGAESVCDKSLSLTLAVFYYLQGVISSLENVRTIVGEYSDRYKQLWVSIANITLSVGFTYLWGISGVVIGTIVCYIYKGYILTPGVIFGSILEQKKKKEYLFYMIMLSLLYIVELTFFYYIPKWHMKSFMIEFILNGMFIVGGVLLVNVLLLRKTKLYKENKEYFHNIIKAWTRK